MPTCGLLRGSGRLPVAHPSRAGGRGADRYLVAAAFDALEHFEAAIVAHGDLVHALELFGDAEALGHHLHGGSGAARGGFPAAEEQQPGAIQAGDGFDSRSERGGGFEGIGEAAGGTVEGHQFKGHFLRHGHHDLLQFGFGSEADQPHFAAGCFLRQVGGFE